MALAVFPQHNLLSHLVSEDTVELCTQDPVIGPYYPVCFPFLEPSTPPWNFQRGHT